MSHETPRSGRAKKKSTLSKLAAQKTGLTPRSSQDLDNVYNQSSSRDDISDALHRQRLNSDRGGHYPVDADVHINRRNLHSSDSDEGIEVGTNSFGYQAKTSSPQRKAADPRARVVSDESEEESESDPTSRYPASRYQSEGYKGEKRGRDQNSDGDDLRGDLSRYRGRKLEPLKRSGSLEDILNRKPPWASESRSKSQTRNDKEKHVRMDTTEFRRTTKISSDSDDDDEMDFCKPIASDKSPELNSRLSMRQTKEDITSSYRDALAKMDRDDEGDYEETHDAVGDMRRFAPSPPRHSTRSPEPHDFHRQLTSSSIASSITSRTFKHGTTKHSDPFGNGSQTSMQSSSVLPMLTTQEARNRSFMVGTVTGSGSLLGAEELERYFPDRKMRVFIGTWNMCELKAVPDCLDDFILPDTSDYVHDLYVVGTQESGPSRREWEISLQQTLGPQHLLLHAANHGVLYICIFIKRDLIWYTSVCEEMSISTRAGPVGIKTKGAIGVTFNVFGTSFLFLNSHLSPHDGHIKDRIADYNKICTGLRLPKSRAGNPQQDEDVTSQFDCVFWMGDLNFRIEKERERISEMMKGIDSADMQHYDDLLAHDELFRARNEGLAFQDFQEGRIKFKPTYKYDKGTSDFDSSKKMRIPSYTDRVLFRVKRKHTVTCLYYDSAHDVMASDHKPVYAMFEVNLRPGRDNIPLSCGNFNKEIWFEANRRRALRLDMEKGMKNQKSSTVCSIQ